MKCFGRIWYDKVKETAGQILGLGKDEKSWVSIPQRKQNNANKRKPEAKKLSSKPENRQYYGYEPTNIGLTFDAEYHGWKRAKSYWKYCNGEEEELDFNKIIKTL